MVLDKFLKKTSIDDLHEFFYVWQTYESFGIHADEAVTEVGKSSTNIAVKEVMDGMLKLMRNGASTADAMKNYPDFFPVYVIEMVRIGERSGQMHEILKNIVFSLGHEMDMEKDIRSAMWMPKVFLLLLLICFAVLVFYVIPNMGAVLQEINMDLPFLTSLVLMFGQFMVSYWYLVLIILVFLFLGWKHLMQIRPDIKDLISFRIPALGEIRRAQLRFRVSSVLGMCLQANVPIRTAIRYAADSCNSYYMRAALMATLRRMEASGSPFLDALQASNIKHIIPDNFFIFIRVGSKGDLGKVLLKLSDMQQKEILRLSKSIGDKLAFSVIMPAALVLVFLVLSIELPIWEVMNNTNLTNLGGGM